MRLYIIGVLRGKLVPTFQGVMKWHNRVMRIRKHIMANS